MANPDISESMTPASASPDAASRPSGGEFDPVQYFGELLSRPDPRFFVVSGPVGSGKSSFLRALLDQIRGPKIYLAYRPPPTPAAGTPPPTGTSAEVGMLLVDPQVPADSPGAPSVDASPESMLAFGAQDVGGADSHVPAPLAQAFERLTTAGVGAVVVDSWDRDSEAYFRARARGTAGVQTFGASPNAIAALQAGILTTPAHLVLAVSPELGKPLFSIADAVVEMRDAGEAGRRLRVMSVVRVRGTSPPMEERLYTVNDGHFVSYPSLPGNFRPPMGASDPDPHPEAPTGWPGSAAFADAFGRFRYGSASSITLAPDCPDPIAFAIAAPVAVHALRAGGRAVWILPPSVRPSRVVARLREQMPAEWVRERLRIVSASGDDPGLGELRSVLLPLAEPSSSAGGGRASGVSPILPTAFRFLRDRPEGTPAVYVISLEGLRSVVAYLGSPFDPAMLPSILELYLRLPKFHLFGYGPRDDPVVPHIRPASELLLDLEMHHGRPVLFGVRPKTVPYLLDWPDGSGRYSLLPVR